MVCISRLIKEFNKGIIYKDVTGNWDTNRKQSRRLPRTKPLELTIPKPGAAAEGLGAGAGWLPRGPLAGTRGLWRGDEANHGSDLADRHPDVTCFCYPAKGPDWSHPTRTRSQENHSCCPWGIIPGYRHGRKGIENTQRGRIGCPSYPPPT